MSRHQKELATALGLSEGQVSKLKRKGMPTQDIEAARVWRSRNIAVHVRADNNALLPPAHQHGQGMPSTALDLGQERAALARAQRLSVEMRNAVQAGQFAPITLLVQVLATASQAVAERFDHLPGQLRKACPELTDRQRDEVVAVIAAARNEWVRSTAELVAADLAAADDNEQPEGSAVDIDAENPEPLA